MHLYVFLLILSSALGGGTPFSLCHVNHLQHFSRNAPFACLADPQQIEERQQFVKRPV